MNADRLIEEWRRQGRVLEVEGANTVLWRMGQGPSRTIFREGPLLAQSGRSQNVGFGMKAGPVGLSRDVRCRAKIGRHLLIPSFSQFDPRRTFGRPRARTPVQCASVS
jgi:hypothetical protein